MAKITLESNYLIYYCDQCNTYCKKPRNYYFAAKAREQTLFFCSQKCKHDYYKTSVKVMCSTCQKEICRVPSIIKKSKTKRFFCDESCAATYNNKLKRKSRRSKIEKKFYDLLVKEFPNLNILANDKAMIDGYEVDVAIPSLKLAIEWNGIVHFKPIYGQTKLDKIQNRDAEKLKIAADKNINLIVISDLVSSDKILQQAFNDVKNIINLL